MEEEEEEEEDEEDIPLHHLRIFRKMKGLFFVFCFVFFFFFFGQSDFANAGFQVLIYT